MFASTLDQAAPMPHRGRPWQRASRLGSYLISGPSYGYGYSRDASSSRRCWNGRRPQNRTGRITGTTNRGHAGRPPWKGYGSRVHNAEADETAEAPTGYAEFQAWAERERAYWRGRSVTDDDGESGKGPTETWTLENAGGSSEQRLDTDTMVAVSTLPRCRNCKRTFPSSNRLRRRIRARCAGRKPVGPKLVEDQEPTGNVPLAIGQRKSRSLWVETTWEAIWPRMKPA